MTLLNMTAILVSELISPGLEVTWKQEQKVSNSSLQPQAEDNIRTNCSHVLQRPKQPRGRTIAPPQHFFKNPIIIQ